MISEIYNAIQHEVPRKIRISLETAIDDVLNAKKTAMVFFRADDIGVYSHNYERMISLFVRYQVPLCMAVVPSWLTVQRWQAITTATAKCEQLFCWHMHGFRHNNHEPQGKKQEFGPSRSHGDLFQDLMKGKKRLETILNEQFTLVFTPPWNRCSNDCMQILKEIGFKAISRSHGSKPDSPEGLKDLQIRVDLHTRKEASAEQGWAHLVDELKQGLASEYCGIMIHHMRMNDAAFVFLEYLLQYLTSCRQIEILTYREMI